MILGLVTGLVLFLCTILAYILGIKHGKQLSQSSVPKLNINPVQVYKEHKTAKEEKAQQDKIQQGWENILNYDGTPQKGDE